MDIGLVMHPTGYFVDIAEVAKEAELLGFESIWVPEHTAIPIHAETKWHGSPEGNIPKEFSYIVDPFIALSRASAVTKKIKLGTAVCLVTQRHPLILAKEIATLDMYSNGRCIVGIGAGWLKEEMEIMGGDFPHRWTQAKENISVMKEAWTKSESEFHGYYHDIPPVYSFPKPVQKPYPPIFLGGRTLKILSRVVQWGDGWLPIPSSPDEIEKGYQVLEQMCAEIGRDVSSIKITVDHIPLERTLIKQYENVGASRAIVNFYSNPDDEPKNQLERIAELIL